MFYQFPSILTIDDVLPHIEGRTEFVVADRGDHIIINYAVAFADTFAPVASVGDAIRRECRGLIFRKSDGKIIRRPFHKFFNVGEKEETQPDVIKAVLDDCSSLEKLDGSMISPFIVDEAIIWGTKMSAVDFHIIVKDFVENSAIPYEQFTRYCIGENLTPIFEWVSPNNRIVIPYKEDMLILTAVRDMTTGIYQEIPLGLR